MDIPDTNPDKIIPMTFGIVIAPFVVGIIYVVSLSYELDSSSRAIVLATTLGAMGTFVLALHLPQCHSNKPDPEIERERTI